jgi:hypothetical protein
MTRRKQNTRRILSANPELITKPISHFQHGHLALAETKAHAYARLLAKDKQPGMSYEHQKLNTPVGPL